MLISRPRPSLAPCSRVHKPPLMSFSGPTDLCVKSTPSDRPSDRPIYTALSFWLQRSPQRAARRNQFSSPGLIRFAPRRHWIPLNDCASPGGVPGDLLGAICADIIPPRTHLVPFLAGVCSHGRVTVYSTEDGAQAPRLQSPVLRTGDCTRGAVRPQTSHKGRSHYYWTDATVIDRRAEGAGGRDTDVMEEAKTSGRNGPPSTVARLYR